MKFHPLASAVLAAFLSPSASAVYLNPDGQGQALIYPYYTVQSADGNAFNTYISIANHTPNAKALRVRVRESRNSREVASFNLFLSPNDVWTGAIIPLLDNNPAAHLLSADRSCVSPAFTGASSTPGVTFQNNFYTGSLDDGNGSGLDRTREGWIEVIEMASLSGAMAAGVTQNSAGIPANCAAVQSPSASDIGAPTGGLSGTLTLINVASGMDFTVNAEALAGLSTRSLYRPATDPYPDFSAVEIDPVSVVVANGFVYRSTWVRSVDAVSAVFMRTAAEAEYVLDSGTRSNTALTVTFPTRQFYVNGAGATPPFSKPARWSQTCEGGAEPVAFDYFNRESATAIPFSGCGFTCPPSPPPLGVCAGAATLGIFNGSAHMNTSGINLLGSSSRGFTDGVMSVRPDFQNGWVRISQPGPLALTSQGDSTRTSIATGVASTGAHSFAGLPMVGFMVRTFVNGTLSCSGGACQGNYGGSFPLTFRRSISP